MKIITKIWFDDEFLYGLGDDGKEYKQSLLWYDRLRNASDDERAKYTFSLCGIHWRNLDEDVSFESFEYEEAIPNPMQKFFLTHKEINIAEFAKIVGINSTLLHNYIRGWKKPSKERELQILDAIHNLGGMYAKAAF